MAGNSSLNLKTEILVSNETDHTSSSHFFIIMQVDMNGTSTRYRPLGGDVGRWLRHAILVGYADAELVVALWHEVGDVNTTAANAWDREDTREGKTPNIRNGK